MGSYLTDLTLSQNCYDDRNEGLLEKIIRERLEERIKDNGKLTGQANRNRFESGLFLNRE